MREIKFRAWDIDGEQMIPWTDIRYDITFEEVFDNEFLEANQYTGLKDKNGVEIYEGDVLKAPDGYVGLVEYSVNKAQFVGKNIGETFTNQEYDTLYTVDGCFKSAEIIGNMYENPELLP